EIERSVCLNLAEPSLEANRRDEVCIGQVGIYRIFLDASVFQCSADPAAESYDICIQRIGCAALIGVNSKISSAIEHNIALQNVLYERIVAIDTVVEYRDISEVICNQSAVVLEVQQIVRTYHEHMGAQTELVKRRVRPGYARSRDPHVHELSGE